MAYTAFPGSVRKTDYRLLVAQSHFLVDLTEVGLFSESHETTTTPKYYRIEQMSNSKPISRRALLQGTVALSAGLVATKSAVSHAGDLSPTPEQTEGPFYPVQPQSDKDLDLTQIKGHAKRAQGESLWITGVVKDERGQPLANAIVDIWQANAAGRYAHAADTNPAPLDPDFQGWGIVTTNQLGEYRFKTIKPGAYKVSGRWSRPPHIHFKVSKRGYEEVTTQMYFDGEPLNDKDSILNNVPKSQRQDLIVKFERADGENVPSGQFDIVLARV